MSFLLYGATGYTGALIAEAAVARGLTPTLSGRNASALAALAERLRLPFAPAALDDDAALTRAFGTHALVLNCAGPFSHTARPMVDLCLRLQRHYLDITGEVSVFERLFARSAEAKARGVVLLPGVGFDVVPSDCMAAHVKRLLPSATSLELCIAALGSLSHGTSATMIEHLHTGGGVRRGGVLVGEPAAMRSRTFNVAGKARAAVSMPWGDLSTAYHSTGVPDITVYFTLPRASVWGVKAMGALAPLAKSKRVRAFLQSRLPAGGPDAVARARGRSVVVAEAKDAAGLTVTSTLTGPEGYTMTVDTALLCVQAMATPPPPGTCTPSSAFGADLVLRAAGVTRVDG